MDIKNWFKERPECSIDELIKRKKIAKRIGILYMLLVLLIDIIVLYLALTGDIIAIFGAVLVLFFTNFIILFSLDMMNDVDRINIWIFLKKKLGD